MPSSKNRNRVGSGSFDFFILAGRIFSPLTVPQMNIWTCSINKSDRSGGSTVPPGNGWKERRNVTEAVKRHTCGCGGNRANGIGKRERVLSDPICKPFFRGKGGNLQALCRPFPIFAYTWCLVCIMEPICHSIKCDSGRLNFLNQP